MHKVFELGAAALLLSVLLGVLLGLGGYTVHYAEGFSYLSDDPRACVNCHVMRDQFDGWQKASHHANATCNDCHVPHDFVRKYLAKAEHGYRHSKAFTLQNFHEPIRITPADSQIVVNNCIRCHEGLVSDLRPHASGGDDAVNCVHCHISVGHGPTK